MKCLIVLLMIFVFAIGIQAQSELAATLEVLESSVSVQRVNTSNPIEVQVEAIVGVGDTIVTGETGRARITFFADGTSTELEPNTTYRIDEFTATEESFTLQVSVLAGRTIQQLGRILDASSSYEVETPAMTMAARGTVFAIRVEENGRSAMLVREGNVETNNPDASAEVPAEFGIRAEVESALSDVVRASTFEQLDAALDGCSISIATSDDVSLNVRSAPSLDAPLLGFVPANDVSLAYGTTESGDWYRFAYEEGYAWILSSTAVVGQCAGLRVFADDFSETGNEAEATPESTETP